MWLKHTMKMYPPRVKLTICWTKSDDIFTIPIRFTGSSLDSQLDVDLKFPIGMHKIIIVLVQYTVLFTTLYHSQISHLLPPTSQLDLKLGPLTHRTLNVKLLFITMYIHTFIRLVLYQINECRWQTKA